MSELLTLAIDQGTHATRAAAYDGHGRMVAHARRPVSLQRSGRTEAEQSPVEILGSLQAVMQELLAHPDVAAAGICSAGLATQRSSVLAWERDTGRALSPVLSWLDTRAAQSLQRLEQHSSEIKQRTGLPLSAHYGAGKLQWLLQKDATVAAAQGSGRLVIGPLASYLLHHLLTGHTNTIDHANAARTLLWNLHDRDWDDWLPGLFGIPREVLPGCRPILADYGVTRSGSIPVMAVNGDQTAALYAQGMPAPHTIRVNIGTGAFVLSPTGGDCRPHPKLLAGLSRSSDHTADYFIEGTINGAGAAVLWIADKYNLPAWQTCLPEWLGAITDPPVFLNTIGDLGSPWWRAGPEPAFPDATTTPDAAHAMVAVIESIVFLIEANIQLLRELDPGLDRIRVGGGLSQADGLCRKLASLSGLVVERPAEAEATARGIAWLAAGCPADWDNPEAVDRFEPHTDAGLGVRYTRFLEALETGR